MRKAAEKRLNGLRKICGKGLAFSAEASIQIVSSVLPVVSGSGAIPQRLLTFKDSDAAASSLAERWPFLLDGFAFKGRYLKVSLPPVQCKRCLKFGHAATACSVEQITCSRCGVVGHSDSSTSCSVVDRENSCCINCRGNHPAWSFKCPAFKEAQKVAAASVKKRWSS